jgi:hypothetical protein
MRILTLSKKSTNTWISINEELLLIGAIQQTVGQHPCSNIPTPILNSWFQVSPQTDPIIAWIAKRTDEIVLLDL